MQKQEVMKFCETLQKIWYLVGEKKIKNGTQAISIITKHKKILSFTYLWDLQLLTGFQDQLQIFEMEIFYFPLLIWDKNLTKTSHKEEFTNLTPVANPRGYPPFKTSKLHQYKKNHLRQQRFCLTLFRPAVVT